MRSLPPGKINTLPDRDAPHGESKQIQTLWNASSCIRSTMTLPPTPVPDSAHVGLRAKGNVQRAAFKRMSVTLDASIGRQQSHILVMGSAILRGWLLVVGRETSLVSSVFKADSGMFVEKVLPYLLNFLSQAYTLCCRALRATCLCQPICFLSG